MNAALSAGTISGFRSDTVTVDGVLLHYWVGGRPDGEPVILWHGFLSNKNNSGKTVRMLCMCTPAGQEEFFMEVGEPVAARTSPAPKPTRSPKLRL
jgi:hypothetical protein